MLTLTYFGQCGQVDLATTLIQQPPQKFTCMTAVCLIGQRKHNHGPRGPFLLLGGKGMDVRESKFVCG